VKVYDDAEKIGFRKGGKKMDEFGRSLCSFGLDPERVRDALRRGDVRTVLASLKKEEETLLLRSIELADLREQLLAMAGEERRKIKDELSDDDVELLSAAGQEPRNIP
jgi:hypothetical protein